MSVTNNLLGMNADRQFGLTTKRRAKNTERLSSGYRINRAADDAAGLAISEKMRRQVRGLTQASRNAQDGISMVQIADGALHEIHDMLQRANQLAVQAANDTNSNEDRSYIQQEIDALATEVDGISDRASFNEILVLKGASHTVTENVPVTTTQTVYSTRQLSSSLPDGASFDASTAASGMLSSTFTSGSNTYVASRIDFSGVDMTDLSKMDGKGFYTTCCTCDKKYSVTFDSSTRDSKMEGTKNITITVGVKDCQTPEDVVNRIISATGGRPKNHYTIFEKDPADASGATLVVHDNRTSATPSGDQGVMKPGVTEEVVTTTETTTIQTVTRTVADPRDIKLQVGAEAGQNIVITLPAIDSEKVGLNAIDVSTHQGAANAITNIKTGLQYVSAERSRMGAYQNRLEHTIANLDNVVENTTEAESRIRDMDMAEGSMLNGMMLVLEQAGTSMLTQANQQQQRILSLLQ